MRIAPVRGPSRAGGHRTLNSQPQLMLHATTVTIEPNDKYREVIRGELPDDEPLPETETEYLEREHAEAADAFQTLVDESPTTDEFDMSPQDMKTLSWDDLSVSCGSDLVAKMATYFDGVDADEPTELIRSKLRLLDVEIYVDAQLAAQEELR